MIAHIAIIPKSTKQIGGVRNDRDVALLSTVRPGISVRGSGRAEMSSRIVKGGKMSTLEWRDPGIDIKTRRKYGASFPNPSESHSSRDLQSANPDQMKD